MVLFYLHCRGKFTNWEMVAGQAVLAVVGWILVISILSVVVAPTLVLFSVRPIVIPFDRPLVSSSTITSTAVFQTISF